MQGKARAMCALFCPTRVRPCCGALQARSWQRCRMPRDRPRIVMAGWDVPSCFKFKKPEFTVFEC